MRAGSTCTPRKAMVGGRQRSPSLEAISSRFLLTASQVCLMFNVFLSRRLVSNLALHDFASQLGRPWICAMFRPLLFGARLPTLAAQDPVGCLRLLLSGFVSPRLLLRSRRTPAKQLKLGRHCIAELIGLDLSRNHEFSTWPHMRLQCGSACRSELLDA